MDQVVESRSDDSHNTTQQRGRGKTKDAYREMVRMEGRPTNLEISLWYVYSLCSHFISTVLLPVVFPLIISQMKGLPPEPARGWLRSTKDLPCREHQMKLYHRLTHSSITVGDSKFSPLDWAAISWAGGVLPTISIVARPRTSSSSPPPSSAASSAFPLASSNPSGSSPPYTAAVVAAATISAATHTRQLGLMVRGFTGPNIGKLRFPARRAIISWLSLTGTAAGSVGATLMAAFTYDMLRRSDKFLSMWIVSIFSGLIWLAGAAFVVVIRPGDDDPGLISGGPPHALRCFRFPHAAGSVAAVFFSSFATMCIFVGGTLYVFGELCVKPVFFLCFWLVYFAFPLVSLPMLHPLQLFIRTDAVRMQLLGLLLSALASGVGFFYRRETWRESHIMVFAVIQSVAAGVVDAFGRVMLLDCAPAGVEGSFAAWHAWVKALGTCAGFAVAAASSSNTSVSFGVAFCAVLTGVVVLIFGNVSNFDGAVAAGHVTDGGGSPAHVPDRTVVEDLKVSHV
ncbi:hypothetical protein ACLOJK_033746 [Asimina triloba]